MAKTAQTPSINQQKLYQQIKQQIPKPKRHKWRQIGAKALAGDQGALARLTKRGLVPKGAGSQPGSSGGGSSGSSGASGQGISTYKPPAITDEMLARSPQAIGPGRYHDAITGLDVNANFGPNPFNPGGGGGLASATASPKGGGGNRAPGGKKLPGSAKAKKGTVPLVYRTQNGFTVRHVGQARAQAILEKRRRSTLKGRLATGLSGQTRKRNG